MASAMISVGDGSKRRTNTSLREISPLGERPSMMSRHTSRVAPLDAGFKVPDTPGEGSGQTPRDTELRDTDSRGTGNSSHVSAVSPSVELTHACRRAQTPPCLSHCPHRDVHGDASEPADRARVSADHVAGARCRAC